MKLQTIKKILAVGILLVSSVNIQAQYTYTDPITGAAVTIQTEIIGGHLDASASAQRTTAATNTTMSALVNEIRSYDKKMLDYLKKANSVFDGIFHAADAIEMAGNVVTNMSNCVSAARRHPQGVLITSLISKRYTKVATEVTSLVANLSAFVKKSGEDNLLNSRERLDILYDVHSRMRRLDRETRNLYWEITTATWTDVARELNPELYYKVATDERLLKEAKRRVDAMGRAWQ